MLNSRWRWLKSVRPHGAIEWVLGLFALVLMVLVPIHDDLWHLYTARVVDREAQIDELAEIVERFFFAAEDELWATEDRHIIKWRDGIVIAGVGSLSAASRDKIVETAATLSELTGLSLIIRSDVIVENPPRTSRFFVLDDSIDEDHQHWLDVQPDIYIFFGTRNTIETVIADAVENEHLQDHYIDNAGQYSPFSARDVVCSTTTVGVSDNPNFALSAAIFIDVQKGQSITNICLVEELSQTLTAITDITGTASVFNDDNVHHELTDLDQMLLRVYYADELLPGMNRDEARPIVRDLVERDCLAHGCHQIWQHGE